MPLFWFAFVIYLIAGAILTEFEAIMVPEGQCGLLTLAYKRHGLGCAIIVSAALIFTLPMVFVWSSIYRMVVGFWPGDCPEVDDTHIGGV